MEPTVVLLPNFNENYSRPHLHTRWVLKRVCLHLFLSLARLCSLFLLIVYKVFFYLFWFSLNALFHLAHSMRLLFLFLSISKPLFYLKLFFHSPTHLSSLFIFNLYCFSDQVSTFSLSLVQHYSCFSYSSLSFSKDSLFFFSVPSLFTLSHSLSVPLFLFYLTPSSFECSNNNCQSGAFSKNESFQNELTAMNTDTLFASLFLSCTLTHTQPHACTHAHTLTAQMALTYVLSLFFTHMQIPSSAYAFSFSLSHSHTSTHTSTHSHK